MSSARSRRPCPVCGAECYACGTPGALPGVILLRASIGPVALHEVQQGGRTVRMKLNAADAERLGATPVDPPAPASATETKKRAPRNKARPARDKGGGDGVPG